MGYLSSALLGASSAFEVGDPMELFVLVKSDDPARLALGLTFRLHGPQCDGCRFSTPLKGSGSPAFPTIRGESGSAEKKTRFGIWSFHVERVG